jgi:FMN-dependent NADH-azoreductase
MTKLLFIEASPRKSDSYSSQVALEFLESYKLANPDHEIEHLPLFETDLSPFGLEGANQKMDNIIDLMSGGEGIETSGEWAGVINEIERLMGADKVLLSAPMWNFSIPYRLKQWIDLVVQVGVSVKVNEKFEYVGQITNRPMQMVLSSGSPYEMRFPLESDGTKTDFQRAYLDHIFRFVGFTDIRLLKVQPTGMPGPDLDAMIVVAKQQAKKAGAAF